MSSVVRNDDDSSVNSADESSECDIMDCAFDGQVTLLSVDESNQVEGTGVVFTIYDRDMIIQFRHLSLLSAIIALFYSFSVINNK